MEQFLGDMNDTAASVVYIIIPSQKISFHAPAVIINLVSGFEKRKLFAEVREKMADFKKTPEYKTWLETKIQDAVSFASGDTVRIYLDPSDEEYRQELEEKLSVSLIRSEIPFTGGMRAVIPEKKYSDRQFFRLTYRGRTGNFLFFTEV